MDIRCQWNTLGKTSQRALQRKMEVTGCGRRVGLPGTSFSFLAL
jgi:hypothetical protein